MTIGTLIRHYRKKKKLTQKSLAQMTGLAEITIRFYESGKITPKVQQVMKLATALDVPVEEFLKLY